MSASVNSGEIWPKELWDVAIVGGGIAGSVAAIHLANHELKTVLLEKESKPHHKVCGEFISSEGVAMLAQAGVDFVRLGAVPLQGVRVHGPKRSTEARLPAAALGLSRYALDEELLNLATKAGAVVRRDVRVKEMSQKTAQNTAQNPEQTGIELQTTAGEILARKLVVATGKSEFRALQNRVGRDSGMVGFKMHLRLKPWLVRKLQGHCELFIFENGYGGLAPIENGLANFCFLIERSALRDIGTTWEAFAYHIARNNREASCYLDGAETVLPQMITVANVPYGFVRKVRPRPGVFCVGDQMAVIPSLTGDGMSIAAMTGRTAAEAIADPFKRGVLRAEDLSVSYQREMRVKLRSQVELGYRLHVLFKSPRWCDWMTYAVDLFPSIVNTLFSQTRVHTDLSPSVARW